MSDHITYWFRKDKFLKQEDSIKCVNQVVLRENWQEHLSKIKFTSQETLPVAIQVPSTKTQRFKTVQLTLPSIIFPFALSGSSWDQKEEAQNICRKALLVVQFNQKLLRLTVFTYTARTVIPSIALLGINFFDAENSTCNLREQVEAILKI